MMVVMVPPVLLPFLLRIPMVISPMVIVALVPFGRMLPLVTLYVTSHPLPFFRRVPAVIIPMITVLVIPFARMLLLAHSNAVRAY